MNTLTIQSQPTAPISTVDALWTLIQNQSKSIRKALIKRLLDAEKEEKTRRQQEYVKQTLTHAILEVREAQRTGKKLMSADEFLEEMRKEDAALGYEN